MYPPSDSKINFRETGTERDLATSTKCPREVTLWLLVDALDESGEHADLVVGRANSNEEVVRVPVERLHISGSVISHYNSNTTCTTQQNGEEGTQQNGEEAALEPSTGSAS
jgi:hypothetical protein